MLAKFIDEGKREHEEMEIFIKEFRTTNELLLKEQNNVLSELKIKNYSTIGKTTTSYIPFPNRLRKEKEEAQQRKFLENLKRFHINIPCQVSNLQINNALADLGASISLMPYTMYEKLGLGEPKLTRMSLELADRSIQYPRGIVKNVLIKVDKFILPINFVILDMPEDSRIPIILGRPFLATARVMIDVFNKKITLKVGDDDVIFGMHQSMKRPPTEDDECYDIDDLDDTINMENQKLLENDQLDSSLLKDLKKSINQSNLESCNSIGNKLLTILMLRCQYDVSNHANEIDEKKPELKDLPSHLEYAYLHGNKSFPIIISSKLSEEEKILLLQVLEKRKGAIADDDGHQGNKSIILHTQGLDGG
ncbi:DNA-directed DNA polymerase [Tanacetum coccineum]